MVQSKRQIAEIKQDLVDVQNEIHYAVEMLTETNDNTEWQLWSDRRYELVKQKRELQDELIKVGKLNIKARRA